MRGRRRRKTSSRILVVVRLSVTYSPSSVFPDHPLKSSRLLRSETEIGEEGNDSSYKNLGAMCQSKREKRRSRMEGNQPLPCLAVIHLQEKQKNPSGGTSLKRKLRPDSHTEERGKREVGKDTKKRERDLLVFRGLIGWDSFAAICIYTRNPCTPSPCLTSS